MVQLKVQDGSDIYFLDLYEESTIKLTLSIEDITTAEAKSVFSRAFRVPATGNNNQFFKHAFMISGIDYDVTVKKPATVLVDGADFRSGHVRLQKIYWNEDQDKIDYEIVFLGETRDFASEIGDASLCDLDLSHLSHPLNAGNVQQSWAAYPSEYNAAGTPITPSFTNGLKDGDVIYPIVDFGNIYPLSNAQPRIATGESHDFTNHDLPLNRLKPMVRAKAIVDAIFDRTEYEYETGGFFDSDLFKQMYVSGWGNVASVTADTSASQNIFSAIGATAQGSDEWLEATNEITDFGSNYNNVTSTYTAPLTGLYVFRATCIFNALPETVGTPGARLLIYKNTTTLLATGFTDYNTTLIVNWSGTLTAGDTIRVYIDNTGIDDGNFVQDQTFVCTAAPGDVNLSAQFDCTYKQIDFIKDLLTSFRLIMAPDKVNPKKFIIEPWVDYINSGDFYDWSDKLDRSKDLIIEPLFDTQTDIINFDHAQDKDFLNEYHENAYKDIYGHLEFNSGNDLLKGEREIKTGWAPTPITQLEGEDDTSQFIIPLIHTHNESGQHVPIKPKTRLLFYNGFISTGGINWRLAGSAIDPFNRYPAVTYSNEWPLTDDGILLSWFNDVDYWGTNVTGFPTQLGSSMYERYWNTYIQSLYNKNARRVTGTFILNNVDLQNFSFDDVIFLDGNYYRPEKVIDAPIGEKAPVKVQLIKLLNYRYR